MSFTSRPTRFAGTDHLNCVSYLSVTEDRVALQDRGQTPLALSNICLDAALLSFRLTDLKFASGKVESMLYVLEDLCPYLKWKVLTP